MKHNARHLPEANSVGVKHNVLQPYIHISESKYELSGIYMYSLNIVALHKKESIYLYKAT